MMSPRTCTGKIKLASLILWILSAKERSTLQIDIAETMKAHVSIKNMQGDLRIIHSKRDKFTTLKIGFEPWVLCM